MEHKEKWINETLESIDGIHQAEANPFLYDKVLNQLNKQKSKPDLIQLRVLYRLAACIVVFIGLNIFTILHFNKSSVVSAQDNKSAFAKEYFSYLDNI
jgi:hypothetical protein